MYGYMGKFLRINLSTGSIIKGDVPEEFLEKYIGAYGFGARILWDELAPNIDPLTPENKIVISTGPLTATSASTSGRVFMNTKSPLTEHTLTTSTAGGHWGPELKYAGYDYIIVEGKADGPVYIWIDDDKVEIRDASHLWGKTTLDTEMMVKEELGDESIRVLCIGPAGENLSRISCVNVDVDKAFGRGGQGAVFGSKNLKAIVVRGTKTVTVKDWPKFQEAVREQIEQLKAETWSWEYLPIFGTSCWMIPISDCGILPTKNFKQTSFEYAADLGEEAYIEKLNYKPWSCFNCHLCAAHYVPRVKSGPYIGTFSGCLEYETAGAFGAKCYIRDLYAVERANYICYMYGLDTISTGQTIATAMEWYEEGIITDEDTGGIELRFGNADAMVKMVEKIAKRDGFGDTLAEGSWRAAREIGNGAEDYVMCVKMQELSASSVRSSKGNACMYAVNERGAHHMEPYGGTIDTFGFIAPFIGITAEEAEKIDRLEDGNKWWVYPLKKYVHLANLLGTCAFTVINCQVTPDTHSEMYSAATGIEKTGEDLLVATDRLVCLLRAFNARDGLRREDDHLPKRFLTEPGPEGPGKGQVVDIDKLLDSYYEAAGYDLTTGIPTKSKFKEVGLEDVADELEALGVPLAP